MEEKKKISTGTIIRTVVLALALINQILTSTGHSPIPIDDDTVTELLSLLITVITSVIAWWKNNSFTQNAILADEVLQELREK